MARPCGVERRLRAGVPPHASANAVTLTTRSLLIPPRPASPSRYRSSYPALHPQHENTAKRSSGPSRNHGLASLSRLSRSARRWPHALCSDLRSRARQHLSPARTAAGLCLAADAIRAASQDDAALVEHWDFDLGGPRFDGKPVCCIDAGDIPTTMHDNTGIHPSARQTAWSDRCLELRELSRWPRSVACDAFCTGANAIARLVRNSLQPHICLA